METERKLAGIDATTGVEITVPVAHCGVVYTYEYEPIPSQYNGEKAYATGPCYRLLPCPKHRFETIERETIEMAAMIDLQGVIHVLPRPNRHWHISQVGMKFRGVDNFHHWKSGFVTNTGRYVGRKEAREIALAAGQIKDDETYQPDTLFSEDVW